MPRFPLIVLFLLILISSVARAEQGPSSATASGTVRIIIPAVAGINIPIHVAERVSSAGGDQSVRVATFSSSRDGGIALIRSSARSEIILASNRPEKGKVTLQSGWSVRDHRLPPGPVRTARGGERVVMEVWQF